MVQASDRDISYFNKQTNKQIKLESFALEWKMIQFTIAKHKPIDFPIFFQLHSKSEIETFF